MNNLECGQASNNNPLTVIGRVSNSSGQVVDLVFEGDVVLKTTDHFEIQRLTQRPSDLAKDFHRGAERPLAFVGVGFGPAPISDFDKLLWKGEFDETKHPRVPGGSPEGGEFCAESETSESNDNDVADEAINQSQILKDLIKNLTKREGYPIADGIRARNAVDAHMERYDAPNQNRVLLRQKDQQAGSAGTGRYEPTRRHRYISR
jgi:hypothetical protein